MLQLHSRSPLQLGQGHIRSDQKNLTCTTVPSEENCKVDLIIVFPNSGGEEAVIYECGEGKYLLSLHRVIVVLLILE